jgi:hypothetical protein
MKKFYYLDASDQVKGPLSLQELDALHKSGNVSATTQVCEEGKENWTPFFQVVRPIEPRPQIIKKKEEPIVAPEPQQELVTTKTPSLLTKDISPSNEFVGRFLLFVGFILVGYFFFIFKTDVSGGDVRVNNLGLMNDKQNGIIVGGIFSIVGAILRTSKAR